MKNSTPAPECAECQTCLEVLQIVLDDEASPEDKAFVEKHIAQCSNCLDCYEVDKTLRSTIKEKIQKKNIPSDLINQIQLKLQALAD